MTDLKCVRCGAANINPASACKFCTIEMESMKAPVPRWFENQPHPAPIYHPQSAPSNSSIGPFNGVGDVLAPTFHLFSDNFWLITKLVVVIVTPLELLKALTVQRGAGDWEFQVGTFLLQLMSNVVIAPALIFGLTKVMQTGVAPGVNQCYRWGAGKLGKLTICAAISGLLTAFGYLLCLIPGITVSVVLSLVYPLAVLETSSADDVFFDSRELTRGHRWKILGAGIVVYGLVFAANWFFSALATFVAHAYFAVWAIPLAGILSAILNQAPMVLCLVIYLSIRRTLEAEHAQ